MRSNALTGGLLMLVLAGCVAHERNGDKAAAMGDWKAALEEYRAALKTGDSPQLLEKYKQAKHEAAAGAFKRAQSCSRRNDWECAVAEADYALQIDEGNEEILRFRASAEVSRSLTYIDGARDQASKGKLAEAFALLDRSRTSRADTRVAAAIATAEPELVKAADTEVERLRAAKRFRDALAVLQLAASIDSTRRERIPGLQAEADAYATAEHDRLAAQGDAELAAKNWAAAAAAYASAVENKAVERTQVLARYAALVSDAERALAQQDFRHSAELYREAVATGADQSGYAAGQVPRVEIRPYAVKIQSVLVKPSRPDGEPWVGPPNAAFAKIAGVAAGALMASSGVGALGAKATKDVVEAVLSIPEENRPNLTVELSLPDGMRFVSRVERSLYVAYEAELVIASNYFDDRILTFKVTHHGGTHSDDVGLVTIAVKDLVEKGVVKPGSQSIVALELAAEPVSGKPIGSFAKLTPVTDGTNVAEAFSVPTLTSHGYRIKSVGVGAYEGDYQNELGLDGLPDLYVEIWQAGRCVYRSPVKQDQNEVVLKPINVHLHIEPSEQLVFRVMDKDISDDDEVLRFSIPARALARNVVEGRTRFGGYFRLEVEPLAP